MGEGDLSAMFARRSDAARIPLSGRNAELSIDRNNMRIGDGSNEARMNSETGEDENRENERRSQ